MSLEWPLGSRSFGWSNPVAWWWSFLTLVSATNIAAWFFLYHYLPKPQGSLGTSMELMLAGTGRCQGGNWPRYPGEALQVGRHQL